MKTRIYAAPAVKGLRYLLSTYLTLGERMVPAMYPEMNVQTTLLTSITGYESGIVSGENAYSAIIMIISKAT